MALQMTKATYRGRATSVSFGESQNGNTQIAVSMAITNEGLEGEWIPYIGHFTDKTAARTIESLMHMGWQGDDPSELDGLEGIACTEALPDEVDLVCEPEEYNGEWQLKVKWVNKPGSGRFAFKEPLSGDKLRAFGAQMRSTVKSVRAAGGAPRKPAGTPSAGGGQRQLPNGGHPNAPGNGVDDDIPFASSSIDSEPSAIAKVIR